MKLDLVMWCKNGVSCLNQVLTRINQVIPRGFVHKRILVDDYSTDTTTQIAEFCGWEVVSNKGKGIGAGANTALEHVDCEFFISFEHDLVLSKKWFPQIPLLLFNNEKAAAAQGIRVPNISLLRKLQEYKIERIQIDGRQTHSIDNTIYRTEIIRELGGFPSLPGMGVDSVLVQKVLKNGYNWLTDFNVVSTHLRNGIFQEIEHYYKYGLVAPVVSLHDPSINLQRMQQTFLYSPLRGFEIAVKKRDVRLWPLYCLIRFCVLAGYMRG